MRKKTFIFFTLFLIFCLALFFRVYFCYDKVFSGPVKYSADDGVYHMRLVENELLGGHFPRRIYFDPFTRFPYGTYVYFTPLFSQLLAGFIWLVSLGKPTLELINKIAPFYSPVFGGAVVFVAYFLAKNLWGRKVALLSSLLTAISPPLLFRSLLGTTDHHVAEVLFSSLTIMFFIFALSKRKKSANSIDSNIHSSISWLKKDFSEQKSFWIFVFLAGFSLGLYFLVWTGALLFLLIIFTSVVLYYLIQYFSRRNPFWILVAGIIIFLVAFLMILPFLGHPNLYQGLMYNVLHIEAFVFSILGFLWLGLGAFYIRQKKLKPLFLLVFLIFSLVLVLFVLRLFFPFLYEQLLQGTRSINLGLTPTKLARELTSEMSPLGFARTVYVFGPLFFLSLFSLAVIFFRFIKERKPEHLLIVVWSIFIIIAAGVIKFWGQNRFSYYLSFNISVLAAFALKKGFSFAWQGLQLSKTISNKKKTYFYIVAGSLITILFLICCLIYPFPFNAGDAYPKNMPSIIERSISIADKPVIKENDWYEIMDWLKNNTPDPGIDYYALYKEPGVDQKTGKINPYPYPESAYGIMARWDVGHMITYYAHRIPVANPFQQGIGKKIDGKIKELGEIVFFLETDEEKAASYLDQLKTKYIISDYSSADPQGLFKNKVKWLDETLKDYYVEAGEELSTDFSLYDNSMITRLHILDGRAESSEKEINGKKIKSDIKTLSHFRLVYESEATALSFLNNSKEEEEIKLVKVFEYVKGARITGKTHPNREIKMSTEVTTNQQRTFIYEQDVLSSENGSFEFTVPYSTFGKGGRIAGQTQFEVFAKPYKLKTSLVEVSVDITEKNVLNGDAINVPNL